MIHKSKLPSSLDVPNHLIAVFSVALALRQRVAELGPDIKKEVLSAFGSRPYHASDWIPRVRSIYNWEGFAELMRIERLLQYVEALPEYAEAAAMIQPRLAAEIEADRLNAAEAEKRAAEANALSEEIERKRGEIARKLEEETGLAGLVKERERKLAEAAEIDKLKRAAFDAGQRFNEVAPLLPGK